jgi:hypothetical protein
MLVRSAKKLLISGLLGIGSLLMIHSAVAAAPADWHLHSRTADEIARVDRTTAYDGSASAMLESKSPSVSAFGTLAQGVVGKSFVGKRIQFSAYIRTRNVRKQAGIWMRAEDANGRIIAFQGFVPGSYLRGTRDWTQVHVAICIPRTTVAVFYGVNLLGPGTVWIDEIRFDVLGKADPDLPGPRFVRYNPPPDTLRLLPRPENLNFEK